MNESYTQAPHRRSPQRSGPSPNAALLIDFDNVTMAMRSNLGQELRNFLNSDIVRGKVSVQRAYADWRRYPQYIVPLSEASIDLIFAPAYGSTKKNATDIRLAIDALELVFTRPEIGTYILLSGDSDFSSLVLKLKEYGKYVIGVGLQESSSDLLVQNCDEYYSYNSLSGLTSAEEMDTSSLGPWELVEKAVERMDDRNDVMRSDRLKQVMLEFDSAFDEKDHGFSKFNRFLAEASSRGLVRLRKIGDGHYEVAPVEREDEDQAPAPSPPEPIDTDGGSSEPARARGDGQRDDGREPGGESSSARTDGRGEGDGRRAGGVEADSLRTAYGLLSDVDDDLTDGGAVRDSEVKREILRRDDSFDEAALGFSKFSRFLRQAYDEGVVELTTDPDGNFHLQPAGAEPVTFEDAGQQAEKDSGPAGAERPEAGGEEAPAGSGGEASGSDAAEATAAGATDAAGGDARPAEEAESPSPEETEGSRGRGRRGGLGRFRRGSGDSGRSSDGGGDDTGVSVGPVDEGAGEAASGPDDDAGETTGGAPAQETEAGEASDASGRGGRRSRRGLGRFRPGRGSGDTPGDGSASPDESEDDDRSVPGPVDEGEEDGAPTAADADGDDAPGTRPDVSADGGGAPAAEIPEEAEGDPAGYMVGNYPGVGRKTADKLVEAFGDSVFEVIDRDPDRLTQVLPDHRARAVVEAREAERRRQPS